MRDRLDAEHMRRRLLVSPDLKIGQRIGAEPDLERQTAQRSDRAQHDLRPGLTLLACRNTEHAARFRSEIPRQAPALDHRSRQFHTVIEQPGSDIHMVHVEEWQRPVLGIDDPVGKPDLARLRIDPPMALQDGLAAIRTRNPDLRVTIRIPLRIPEKDFGRVRGERSMQRVSGTIAASRDRLRMANVIWPAGEQKTFQRVIDPWIAVVRDGAPRRDIYPCDQTCSDIENGTLVEMDDRPFAAR